MLAPSAGRKMSGAGEATGPNTLAIGGLSTITVDVDEVRLEREDDKAGVPRLRRGEPTRWARIRTDRSTFSTASVNPRGLDFCRRRSPGASAPDRTGRARPPERSCPT